MRRTKPRRAGRMVTMRGEKQLIRRALVLKLRGRRRRLINTGVMGWEGLWIRIPLITQWTIKRILNMNRIKTG